MPDTIVHVVGSVNLINEQYLRQVCTWCGAILVTADLEKSPGARPIPHEPPQLVRYRGREIVAFLAPGSELSEDSCIMREFRQKGIRLPR